MLSFVLSYICNAMCWTTKIKTIPAVLPYPWYDATGIYNAKLPIDVVIESTMGDKWRDPLFHPLCCRCSSKSVLGITHYTHTFLILPMTWFHQMTCWCQIRHPINTCRPNFCIDLPLAMPYALRCVVSANDVESMQGVQWKKEKVYTEKENDIWGVF